MTAAASGSERAASGLGLNPKAAGFRRLFNDLGCLSKAGKNRFPLLDIGKSLC
jgi:hypothetical protein